MTLGIHGYVCFLNKCYTCDLSITCKKRWPSRTYKVTIDIINCGNPRLKKMRLFRDLGYVKVAIIATEYSDV